MPQMGGSEIHRRLLSFRYAISGWAYALRTQRNTWIHALATLIVILVAWWLGVSRTDWAILILATALVWTPDRQHRPGGDRRSRLPGR